MRAAPRPIMVMMPTVYDRLNRQIDTIDPLYNTSSTVYDADGNVVQTTDADGRTIQYVYDPLNRQVEEDWLSPPPPGEGGGEGGSVYHAIHTYYDADGETVGVTETDTTDPADCTNYEYTYDADGDLLTSRMAPCDLVQTPQAVYAGTLSFAGEGTLDWNGTGTLKPAQSISLPYLTPARAYSSR